MANKNKGEVGFVSGTEAAAKRRNLNKDRTSRVTLQGYVLGDALICLERAVHGLGVSVEEVSTPSHNPIVEDTPFIRHQTSDGTVIPFGSYRVGNLGQVTPILPRAPTSPELQLQVMFEHGDVKVLETAWNLLIARTYEELKVHTSIFKGRAIKITDPRDLLVPNYIDLSSIRPVFLNPEVRSEIDTSLLRPVREWKALKEVGLGGQRAVLLHGKYGTGKTLIAYEAARDAITAGMTFILCTVDILVAAVIVGRYMEPSTIFVEDLDGIQDMGYGALSSLRNTISGVDAKGGGHDVIAIFSTNLLDAIEKVDRSLLRPDRIDAIVEITPPDVPTVKQVIDHYLQGWKDDTANWLPVAEAMVKAQCTPAVIVEILKRAKLKAFGNGKVVQPITVLKGIEDMLYQIRLAEPVAPVAKSLGRNLAENLRDIAYSGYTELE